MKPTTQNHYDNDSTRDSVLIEAWPEDRIIHIYRSEDAQAQNVEATPIDALPGLYRLESWSSNGNVAYFGYKWLWESNTPLPTWDRVELVDNEWSHWVNKDDWQATRGAWDRGESYQNGVHDHDHG